MDDVWENCLSALSISCIEHARFSTEELSRLGWLNTAEFILRLALGSELIKRFKVLI